MLEQQEQDSLQSKSERLGLFRSIHDFDLNDHEQSKSISQRLNSPRSKEAMRILGLTCSELLPINYENIKKFFIKRDRINNVPKDLIDLRYKMLDKRRHSKAELIKQKRFDMIRQAENDQFSFINGGVSRQSKQFITLSDDQFNEHNSQNLLPQGGLTPIINQSTLEPVANGQRANRSNGFSNTQDLKSKLTGKRSTSHNQSTLRPRTINNSKLSNSSQTLQMNVFNKTPLRSRHQTNAQHIFPKFISPTQSQRQYASTRVGDRTKSISTKSQQSKMNLMNQLHTASSQHGDLNSTDRFGVAKPTQSSMLEQEMKALQKIKDKQRKEIGQMIDFEMKTNQMKIKNAENMKKQQEKEQRHQLQIQRRKQEQELKKMQDAQFRADKAKAEKQAQQKRALEILRKEEQVRRKHEQDEIERLRDMKRREEDRKLKLAELQKENRRKQALQEKAMKIRRLELEKRDIERSEQFEKKNRDQQAVSLQRRQAKELKIKLARDQAEIKIQQQREMLMQREHAAEIKLQQFEQIREEQNYVQKLASQRKMQSQIKIQKDAKKIEEKKKQDIMHNMSLAEIRQQKLKEEQDKIIEQKRIIAKEKEQQQKMVLLMHEKKMERQKQKLLKHRQDKDLQLKKTYEQREYEAMIRREEELLKREERLENVNRIAKANQYQNQLVSYKIEQDKLRGEQIIQEKSDMLSTRFQIRREAEAQKRQMLESVELMKKKGKLTKDVFSKLGLDEVQEEMSFNNHSQADLDPQALDQVILNENSQAKITVIENQDDFQQEQ